ncbi:hypothetical protein ABKV19_005998 [Rosa sericea]
MADIGDDGAQLQGKELYKHQFKQTFTTRLTEILAFDPNSVVSERGVIETLEKLNRVAIMYGRSYIAEDESEYVDCSNVIGFGLPLIGRERCFMQLLRECDPQSEVGRKLWNMKHQAALVGEKVSQHLIRMMVVMNTENKKEMMKKFRDTVHLFPFLVDAFEWPGRSEYFGVVYNRINVLMEHARKEFLLQVKRSKMPAGSLGYVEDLLINLDNKNERDEFLDDLLDQIVEVISMLESLLSFPLLPDGPRLLSRNVRSVAWLRKELVDMEIKMHNNIGKRVRELMVKYKRNKHFNDIAAFLTRVYSPRHDMWEDLESVVQEVKGPQSRGRVRLHVGGTIIQKYRNSALIRIVGINTMKEAEWFTGKHIVYFYRANVKKNNSHYRCIWGKVTRPHDNSGILCAKFNSNLLPRHGCMRVYMCRARINYELHRPPFVYGD